MKKIVKNISLSTLLILISIIIGFKYYKSKQIKQEKNYIIKSEDFNITIKGIGYIDSEKKYEVGTEYSGKLLNFNKNIGDIIKNEEIIGNIDIIDLNYKIKELNNTIEKLKENIKELEINKKININNENYLKSVYLKNLKLFKNNSISELDLKKYKLDYENSKLKTKSFIKQINSLKYQINEITNNILGLKEKLKRYTIKSPINGFISKKYVDNNNIILNGKSIVQIINPNDIWIKTYIDTRLSLSLNKNNIIEIKLRSNPNKIYYGYIYKFSPLNNDITNERIIYIKFKKLPKSLFLNEQVYIKIIKKELKNIEKIPLKYKNKLNQKDLKNKIYENNSFLILKNNNLIGKKL